MIMPYLSFNGNCEEAFLWYAEIFGGTVQHMAKYGDIPETPGAPLSDEQKQKVMHAYVSLDETSGLSGADALWPIENGNSVALQAHLPTAKLAQKAFTALADGGQVLRELVANPPPDDSSVSGSVKDKYGFTWILSA